MTEQLSAHHVLIVHVETRHLNEARAIARSIVDPILPKENYAEILIYFLTVPAVPICLRLVACSGRLRTVCRSGCTRLGLASVVRAAVLRARAWRRRPAAWLPSFACAFRTCFVGRRDVASRILVQFDRRLQGFFVRFGRFGRVGRFKCRSGLVAAEG